MYRRVDNTCFIVRTLFRALNTYIVAFIGKRGHGSFKTSETLFSRSQLIFFETNGKKSTPEILYEPR